MHRCITLCLLICLAVPHAESAPKKGDDKPVVLYLPTTVGDKRVLETTWGGKTEKSTEWVTAVERRAGVTVVSVGPEAGGPAHRRYEASADGVVWVANEVRALDPPFRLLKLPAKEGEAWARDVGPPGQVLTFKLTTGGEEEVEVPAGKFRAVRVEAEAGLPAPFAVTRTTYWHAPGVGVVKTVEQIKGGDRVEVLKSFTPGPKK